MGVAFHLFYEWWRESLGLCVLLAEMFLRDCVYVFVKGMWLVKHEISSFPSQDVNTKPSCNSPGVLPLAHL